MKKEIPIESSLESGLIKRILEVRYTDLEEEKKLCARLLEESEAKQYVYGMAFAYVYLLDSHLALGEYGSCDFFLMQASNLCWKYGFDDLMMMLCNYAGLYYQKRNDDQAALNYFLKGKKLSDKLDDMGQSSKFYNNIGYAMAFRKDWKTAKAYFQRAYDVIKGELTQENIPIAVSSLTNLAEVCENVGDDQGARKALERCEELSEDSLYSRIRLGCSWCAYYAMIGDGEKCAQQADQLIAMDLSSVEDQFFVCDMVEGLCNNMLAIGDRKRSKQVIDMIDKMAYNESLSLQFRVQCLKIRYWEQYDETEGLIGAFETYYRIAQEIAALEDEMLVQSLRIKVKMNQAKMEHNFVKLQNQELENQSQLDKLTGLYNRRYFNKMVSKVVNNDRVKTVGFIMVDVDYFKQYNDCYGHVRGDDVLKAVAQVLSSNSNGECYVSRYGGDEFVCLCVNLQDGEVEQYIQSVLNDLKSRHIPHEKHMSSEIVTISMGYSNETIEPGVESDELLELADRALYLVKNGHKNGYARKKRMAQHTGS